LSLQGKTILVTRQKEQSAEFVTEIEHSGGRALVVPMIQIANPDSWGECDRALDRIESYQALVFTSINGVNGFFGRSDERKIPPERFRSLHIMAVGKRTRESIEQRGYDVHMIPETFSARSLINAVQRSDVEGKSILAPRGNLGRDEVQVGLENLGAVVEPIVVYRNVKPKEDDGRQLWNSIRRKEIDVLTFASPSAVVNFSTFVSARQLRSLGWALPIAVIGPTTRDAALKRGYDVAIMGTEATVKGLVQSIAGYFEQ